MTLGFADYHAHQFTNLGFGGLAFWGSSFAPGLHGRPVDEQLPYAMPWCDVVHGAGGSGDWTDHLMMMRAGHLVGGCPEFNGWPRWDSVTHQAMFESSLKRAVDGGLRLMVTHAVNNERMTAVINRRYPIEDTPAVDRQLAAAWMFQDHVDRRYAGDQAGWYRLVFTPSQAREVIAEGKLAVVLGIEVDQLFDSYTGARSPTWKHVREELDRAYARGVRHVFPLHFADNAFGGTGFQNKLQIALTRKDPNDPGWLLNATGTVNPLNPLDTNAADTIMHLYRVVTEPAPEYEYRTGRRNVRGLTALGKQLIPALIERGVMIDIDHTSFRTRSDVLDLCAAADYPVVSGHTGLVSMARGEKKHEGQLTDDEVKRVRALGGVLAVVTNQGGADEIITFDSGATTVRHVCGGTSQTLLQVYRKAVRLMGAGPVAFGTDFNGFLHPPGPRFGDDGCPSLPPGVDAVMDVGAPRLSYGQGGFVARARIPQVRLRKSKLGDRTYDFNVDGLAHYGMLPDLIADLEVQGLPIAELDPLLHSAEGYIDAWEKAWNNPAHMKDPPELHRPEPFGSVHPGAFCHTGMVGLSKHGVGMYCEQYIRNLGRWTRIP